MQRSRNVRSQDAADTYKELKFSAEPFLSDSGRVVFLNADRYQILLASIFFPRVLDRCPTGYNQEPISGRHWRQFSSLWHVSR